MKFEINFDTFSKENPKSSGLKTIMKRHKTP